MKRWALMNGAVCANVVEQDAMPEIGGEWRDITGLRIGPGHVLNGSTWSTAVPVAVVTRRQALRALHDAGLLALVEEKIGQLPPQQQAAARIDWDNATEFRRDFPLLIQLAAALGLSSSDIDNLFAAAASIP